MKAMVHIARSVTGHKDLENDMLQIPKNAILAQGKKELERYLGGEKITHRQAVLAKCYECMCGYLDGKLDCGIKDCPNYRFMPYRGKK